MIYCEYDCSTGETTMNKRLGCVVGIVFICFMAVVFTMTLSGNLSVTRPSTLAIPLQPPIGYAYASIDTPKGTPLYDACQERPVLLAYAMGQQQGEMMIVRMHVGPPLAIGMPAAIPPTYVWVKSHR